MATFRLRNESTSFRGVQRLILDRACARRIPEVLNSLARTEPLEHRLIYDRWVGMCVKMWTCTADTDGERASKCNFVIFCVHGSPDAGDLDLYVPGVHIHSISNIIPLDRFEYFLEFFWRKGEGRKMTKDFELFGILSRFENTDSCWRLFYLAR